MPPNVAPLDLQRKYISEEIEVTTPRVMREQRRWTPWRLVEKRPGEKPAKVPKYKSNEPETWVTFAQALKEARAGNYNGIGYQQGPALAASPIVVIDIDKCITPDGKLLPYAATLVATLPGFYWERGPSGNGLHGFGLRHPDLTRDSGGIPEIYTGESPRYITVTGDIFQALPEKLTPPGGVGLAGLKRFSPSAAAKVLNLPLPEVEPVQDWRALMTLAPLAKLPKAAQDGLTATTAAGEGERSNRLWLVNSALLNKGYPPEVVYRIGISCPGIWLCCVAKRDEERASAFLWEDILRAVAKQEADRETAALQKADWDSYNLKTTVTRQGVEVLFTPYNARLVIEQHPLIAKRLQMDGSTGEIIWEHRRGDGVLVDVGEVVREVCGWDQTPSNEWLKSPVLDVSEKSLVYPKADELRALRWDGEQRLDTWLLDHVADPNYLDDPMLKDVYREMGRMMLIGYVARQMDPGCKLDTVPVLIGKEGAGKNKLITALAGSIDKVASVDSFTDRDDLLVMAQAEIVELSETHAMRNRRTTNDQLKGFITRQVDTYRHPYAARAVKVRRGFIIMATANNPDVFTAMQDGLRRFWPIHVKARIDIEWVEQNRTQLIAEAVTAYLSKERFWYDEAPAGLRTLHAGSTQYDAITEKVEQLVESQKGKGALTFQQVREALEEYATPDNHLAGALTQHGVTKQKLRIGDKRVWVWGVELWGRPRPQAAPTEAQQAAAAHGASTRVDPDDLDPLS